MDNLIWALSQSKGKLDPIALCVVMDLASAYRQLAPPVTATTPPEVWSVTPTTRARASRWCCSGLDAFVLGVVAGMLATALLAILGGL